MWTLIKWGIIVILIGGVTYYFMDYNDKEESSIIESTKEFSKDVVSKTIKETKELKENIAEAADSSETLQNMRRSQKLDAHEIIGFPTMALDSLAVLGLLILVVIRDLINLLLWLIPIAGIGFLIYYFFLRKK